MLLIANYILPIIVLIIIGYGLYKKINIYEVFIDGAKEGLMMIINIFGSILAMVVSVNVFLQSNILTNILNYIEPLLVFVNVPKEILPLAIMRPLSGSSSLMILNNILANNPIDSYISRVACLIQSSTETTIYVIGLYYGSIKIKNIRHSLIVGLLTDLFSFVIVILLVNMLWQ